MSHLYDLSASGLGSVANDLGAIDTALQIANYSVSSSSAGLKKIRDTDIPSLIDPSLSAATEDFDALTAYQSTVRANEVALIKSINTGLVSSVQGLDAYFTKQFSLKLKTYVSTNDTNNAFLVGGQGAVLGAVTTSSGAITAVAIISGGAGYNTNAVVAVSGGTGATLAVVVNGSGVITSITVSSGGTGYTNGSTASVAPSPILSAPFRFLYGRTMSDEFTFRLASKTYDGSAWAKTAATTDNLNIYGPAAITVVVGANGNGGISAGTLYNVSVTGLVDSATGLSAGTVTASIGSLTAAVAAGTKVVLGTSGKKYMSAISLGSGGPTITPITVTVTTLTGGSVGDNLSLTTV